MTSSLIAKRMCLSYKVTLSKHHGKLRLRVPLTAIGFFFEDILRVHNNMAAIPDCQLLQTHYSILEAIVQYSRKVLSGGTTEGIKIISARLSGTVCAAAPGEAWAEDSTQLESYQMSLYLDDEDFCCVFPRRLAVLVAEDLRVMQRTRIYFENVLDEWILARLWTDLMSLIQHSVPTIEWELVAPLPMVTEAGIPRNDPKHYPNPQLARQLGDWIVEDIARKKGGD